MTTKHEVSSSKKLQKIWKFETEEGEIFFTTPEIKSSVGFLPVEQGYFITKEQIVESLTEAYRQGEQGDEHYKANDMLFSILKQLGVEE